MTVLPRHALRSSPRSPSGRPPSSWPSRRSAVWSPDAHAPRALVYVATGLLALAFILAALPEHPAPAVYRILIGITALR